MPSTAWISTMHKAAERLAVQKRLKLEGSADLGWEPQEKRTPVAVQNRKKGGRKAKGKKQIPFLCSMNLLDRLLSNGTLGTPIHFFSSAERNSLV